MDYSKKKLKDLLTIIRNNQKTQEVQKALNITNLKYAKKKDIVEFLVNNNITIEENNTNNELVDVEDEGYKSSDAEDDKQEQQEQQEQQDQPLFELPVKEDIVLNLENIKNKKKSRKVYVEDEEIKTYREECRVMIEQYKSRYTWLRFEKINYDDPIEALKIVQSKVSTKNFSKLVTEGFFMACDVVETASTETQIIKKYCKLEGFANNVRANDAIKDVLDELIIKYSPQIMGEGGALSPEVRLALALIGCAWSTHSNNSINSVKNKNASEFKYDKTL